MSGIQGVMGGEKTGAFYTIPPQHFVYITPVLQCVHQHKLKIQCVHQLCLILLFFSSQRVGKNGRFVHMNPSNSCLQNPRHTVCPPTFFHTLLTCDMELGKCGRSLRSLASPVLRAFGAPSSAILLYPMLGLSC